MPASPRTTCAHNAPGQVLVQGRDTTCRKCGAPIRPAAESVDAKAGFIPSEKGVSAKYPAAA